MSESTGLPTTDIPAGSPNELPLWIIVTVAVVALIVALITVASIVFSFSRRRKKVIRRQSDIRRDQVDRVFSASLKGRGMELLREDYERYVKSDVTPLKDRQDSRRLSATAAYDEVPYSPDDVIKLNTSIPADIKRQKFAESRSSEIDSGNSSLASNGKEKPHHTLQNGTAYNFLRQSSSVDRSEVENMPEPRAREIEHEPRKLSGSNNEGEDGSGKDGSGKDGDKVAPALHEEREVDESDGTARNPDYHVGHTKFARSNSSFDQTNEVGITRL